jgi:MFS family permease
MSVARAPDDSAQVSLGLLGIPALSLALAITTVSVLIPVSLQKLTTSSLLVGAVVAGEGLIALSLPLWVGPLSDRTRTRLGGRLPYMILGTGLCAAALLLLPFTASMFAIALLVLVFYVGYFVYYPAYRALYPDMVPRPRFGRSQGIQALCREVGMTLSLTASPILFSIWAPLPFLVCAGTLIGTSATLVLTLRPHLPLAAHLEPRAGARKRLVYPSARARRVLLANALWEFALSGMKSFVVLYVVVGTGRSPVAASGLMAIVALVAVVAAPVAGRLADRFGTVPVVRAGLYVYSLGVLLPCFTGSLAVLLPAMPLVGFGGTVVMTLPYALLAESLGDESHGTNAGWYEFSRGLGVSAGPIVTGAAIDVLEPVFPSTHGYGAMWLVQGVALLLSVLLLPARSTDWAHAR